MQVTVDTRDATAFELNTLAEMLQKLAATRGYGKAAGNGSPDSSSAVVVPAAPLAQAETAAAELGNDAPTDIPPAPVSAPVSESPSPVPAAPSVIPAAPAAVPTAATPLDKAGFPWDARIHTANKAVIGDGTWRKKPGVDPALYASVQAEWTAGKSAGSATGQASSTETPTSGHVPAAPATDPNAAATGAIPAAPAQTPAAPVAPTLTAQDVLARCTEIQMSDMNKGSALFQAIVASGVAGGPMALPAVTDPAVLAACLAAVNLVAAA
jgi:hypothetical protein